MFGECHGHIFMNGRNYKEAVERHKNGVDRKLVEDCLEQYRKAGITFIREGGDRYGISSYAARIAADHGIDYRSPVFAIHKKGHYGGIVGMEYETLPQFAELVKKAAGQGADFIKLMFAGLLDFDAYGQVTGTALEFSEMKELVHICHEEGFSVMVHVNGAEAVRNAVLSGADSIEHGGYMTSGELELLARTGTIWVPTVSPVGNLRGTGRFDEASVEAITAMQISNVGKALALGVNVALGSDAGAVSVPHCTGLSDEYGYMLEAAGGNRKLLDSVLSRSEALIKERFRRH